MDKLALVALHRHFLAADAVKQFLFTPVEIDSTSAQMPEDFLAAAQFWSRILRLQVFYALLYVVIEGYRELKCTDPAVDPLLAQSDFVEAFRRFRNANFHFHEDPISPKLVEFLAAKGSDIWAHGALQSVKSIFREITFDQRVPRQPAQARNGGG